VNQSKRQCYVDWRARKEGLPNAAYFPSTALRQQFNASSATASLYYVSYLAVLSIRGSSKFKVLRTAAWKQLSTSQFHEKQPFLPLNLTKDLTKATMASPFPLILTRDHTPNFTIPTYLCTLDTCSVFYQAQLQYDPSLGGNVFFAALFSLLLCLHILLGIYYRTWSYGIGMVFGLSLELCGYIGRIQMHYNPFIQSPFFMFVSPHSTFNAQHLSSWNQ
jgi:hypothetical protein